MRGEVVVFGLVLSGPEGPVASGQRVVFAGLAPPGTQSVTLRGAPTGDRVVRARPDGSFVAAVDTVVSGQLPSRRGAPRQPRRARAGAATGPRRADRRRDPGPCDAAAPGATAVLQTYDRDHFTWRGIARAKLDGRSRVRFSLPDGLDRVRVVVVGTKGWADGVSRAVRPRNAT